MPTYEYRCANCGHELERFQQMSDNPIRKCPECKRQKLKRLMGAGSGIIFKGSGFYETDYKRKNSRSSSGGSNGSADSNGSASKSKDGDSSTAKSDKTPAEKASSTEKKKD